MSAQMRFQAIRELLRRYGHVIKDSWVNRKSLSFPRLTPDEAEFMPAALAVQTRPVSPTARVLALLIGLGIVFTIVWSIFGRFDIVVVASGKVLPVERTKTISVMETARVRAIHVRSGQAVKAGDLLLELDTSLIENDRERAQIDVTAARIEVARANALISALDQNRAPQAIVIDGVPREMLALANMHLMSQYEEYKSKVQRLKLVLNNYKQLYDLTSTQEKDYSILAASGDIPRHSLEEKRQALIELSGRIADMEGQHAALTAEVRRSANDSLHEGMKMFQVSLQNTMRASAHENLLRVTAPIDGTVEQLKVTTIGGAVAATQALMDIVPNQAGVELEAFLENKDVGFVHEGQTAVVKFSAFNYTNYGTIGARVVRVSKDAVNDEKLGVVYSVKLLLDKNTFNIDGKEFPIGPGLTASADIVTGDRRVIQYFLSPLIMHVNESMKER